MANEKSAKDLSEIMSEQLDATRKSNGDEKVFREAEVCANIVGKMLKLSALEMAYANQRKQAVGIIPGLER